MAVKLQLMFGRIGTSCIPSDVWSQKDLKSVAINDLTSPK